jgi:flagellar hook capping protein FlgD
MLFEGVIMFFKISLVICILSIFTVTCLAEVYTENFDTVSNWNGGYSWYGDVYYVDDDSEPLGDQFYGYSGMRETTYVHSGTHAWEIDNTVGRYLRYEVDDITVSSFSIWCAKRYISYDLQVQVRYSTDSGGTWQILDTLDDDFFLTYQVYYEYSHTFDTPVTNEPGETLYIDFRYAISGEWAFYDDFTVNYTPVIYPPPADHVTDFTAISNVFDAIDLSWTDTDDALGYLIKTNTENSFTDPEDGTPIDDGEAVKNFSQGTEIFELKGLHPGTQYYFKIWPYTNYGSNIDYKTDGSVPVANITTDVLPESLYLIISEIADPLDDSNADYVELYNASDYDINFDEEDWYLSLQMNGTSWVEKKLTGIIPAHGVYICASYNNNESDYFYTSFGFMADYSTGFSMNGDEGFFLYYNGNHNTGSLVDIYGQMDVNGIEVDWSFPDSQAERVSSIATPNPSWTTTEWVISGADAEDMTPGIHIEGGEVHQTINMGGGDTVTFPSSGSEEVTIELDESETGYVQVAVTIENQMFPGANNSYSGWWDIEINGNTQPVDFVFTYDEAELNGIIESNLIIFHFVDEDWENLGGILNTNENTITLTGYNGTYSPFTLADGDYTNLPVTLSSFTATYSSSQPVLQWITQSEISNAGWNVYRAGNEDFSLSQRINTELISGHGTTSETSHYAFSDEYELIQGESYYYWLESISYSGDVEDYGPVMLTIPFDEEEETPDVPERYSLLPNYPNPFNPSTLIKYNLPQTVNVQLTIYNVKGAKIKVLESGTKEAGYHQITWDGTDKHDQEVSSGVYLYELVTPYFVKSRTMLLIK